MKKVVLKLDLHDDKSKQKAMSKVSSLSGVESITMDMKDKKLTVTGDIDPVTVVAKLRKLCHTDILTVGPAKEPEKKKEEPKKEEPKKPDEKKKDPKDDAAAAAAVAQAQAYHAYQQQLQAYYQYPPTHMQQHAYLQHPPHYYRSAEEDPNSCVIC